MRLWVIWGLLIVAVSAAASAAELTGEDRALNEQGLATLRGLLSSPDAAYSEAQREILETQAAVIDARLRGNDAEELRLGERLFLLSRDEVNQTGESTLGSVLGVDFAELPMGLMSLCRNAEDIPNAERVTAADRISRYEPDNLELQDMVVGIMLETKSHAEVVPYCSERINDGHDYFRCVRASMRVGAQRDLIEKALAASGANAYDPSVAEHAQAAMAFEEAWDDQTPNPRHLVAYCDVLLDAYAVTLTNPEAVSEYMDEALSRMGDWPDPQEVAWAVDGIAGRRALLADNPPDSAVWTERRALAAYGPGKWKMNGGQKGRRSETASAAGPANTAAPAATPPQSESNVPKPSPSTAGAVPPNKKPNAAPASTPSPVTVVVPGKENGQAPTASEPTNKTGQPISQAAPAQPVAPAVPARKHSIGALPILIGCVAVGAILLVVLCIIWWVQRKRGK